MPGLLHSEVGLRFLKAVINQSVFPARSLDLFNFLLYSAKFSQEFELGTNKTLVEHGNKLDDW